jgi:hypothetical protein
MIDDASTRTHIRTRFGTAVVVVHSFSQYVHIEDFIAADSESISDAETEAEPETEAPTRAGHRARRFNVAARRAAVCRQR